MFHWPMMSMLVGISFNMFFLSIVAFVSWYRFVVEPQLHAMKVAKQQASRLQHEQRRRQARAQLERRPGELLDNNYTWEKKQFRRLQFARFCSHIVIFVQ